MTQEETKQLLPIMEAFAKGEKLQLKCGEQWKDLDNIAFSHPASSYRIKPKPLERWLATPTAFGLSQYPDMKEELCKTPPWQNACWTYTLMREVEQP